VGIILAFGSLEKGEAGIAYDTAGPQVLPDGMKEMGETGVGLTGQFRDLLVSSSQFPFSKTNSNASGT